MADRIELKDPRKGLPLAVTVVPSGDLSVVSHQRKPSKPHIKSVAASIERLGFVVPLVVYEEEDQRKYVIIDGQHRFLAGRELGVEEFPVVIVPRDLAVRMMSLNTERHLNIRERAYVSLQIYRQFVEEQPDIEEGAEEIVEAIELAHNATLGYAYEKSGRLAGSAFEPILKRCDFFLDLPLRDASGERDRRGTLVVEADALVRSVSTALKEMGVETAYASAMIVAHANPIKRAKSPKPFDEVFDKLTAKLSELAEDPSKARRIVAA